MKPVREHPRGVCLCACVIFYNLPRGLEGRPEQFVKLALLTLHSQDGFLGARMGGVEHLGSIGEFI